MRKLVLILGLLLCGQMAKATTVSGAFANPALQPPVGTACFTLVVPGGRTAFRISVPQLVLPTTTCFTLASGQMPSGSVLVGDDDLVPGNTYYSVQVKDNNGNLLGTQLIYITGSAMNLASATYVSTTPTIPTFTVSPMFNAYAPTSGGNLVLAIGAGNSFCNGQALAYGGGSVTLLPSTTNYVYLDPTNSCNPGFNATGFVGQQIPIATVTTSSGAISTITDDRTWFANFSGSTPRLNTTEYVDGFTNPTIAAAIAALPAAGGTVVVPPGHTETLTSPLVIGSASQIVHLMVDRTAVITVNIQSASSDAIQLYSKSSMQGSGNTNAAVCNFCLASTAQVNTLLATYPQGSGANLTDIEGITFEGTNGAVVTTALVELYNPTDITEFKNNVVWNFFGVGLEIYCSATCGGSGPLNFDNDTVNGLGNPGARPVLISGSNGGGSIGPVNFFGGSYVHPGTGGLPIVDLEGGSSGQGIYSVNFYGSQFESVNTGDIGILVNNARNVYGSGLTFSAGGGTAGANCVEIEGSDTIAITLQNISNAQGWTDTINDTVNSYTDTTALVGSYTVMAATPLSQVWAGNNYVGAGVVSKVTSSGITTKQLSQVATKQFAGTCAMVSGTSCTWTFVGPAFNSTPICISSQQSSGTPIASSCALAGSTVTITAASSNSNTFGAVLIGNPN